MFANTALLGIARPLSVINRLLPTINKDDFTEARELQGYKNFRLFSKNVTIKLYLWYYIFSASKAKYSTMIYLWWNLFELMFNSVQNKLNS